MTEIPSQGQNGVNQQAQPNMDGLPAWLQRRILTPTTRRGFLIQRAEETALAVVSNRAVQAAAIVVGSFLQAACDLRGNTAPAYSDTDKEITLADFEKGIDRLATPAQRSIVLLEAVQGGKIKAWGHGVLAYRDDGTLMLYTAYHVIIEPQNDLGTVHWTMRVGGGVGDVSLEKVAFNPKPDSGVTQDQLAYGVMQADLTQLQNSSLQSAIDQGQILPAVVSPTPNHDMTTNKGLLVMYMADGNPDHDAPSVVETSSFISDSGQYEGTLISGGTCMGMSGSPLFKGVKSGSSYQPATTPEGNFIVEAVNLGFYPESTDPAIADSQQCSNGSDNITAIALYK